MSKIVICPFEIHQSDFDLAQGLLHHIVDDFLNVHPDDETPQAFILAPEAAKAIARIFKELWIDGDAEAKKTENG
jgi:hypothetical protein